MPTGVIVNALSVMSGGLLGCILGDRLPEDVKEKMNWIFGCCSLGMGIPAIVHMQNMPAVVFSVIIGSLLGMLLHFGAAVEKGAARAMNLVAKDSDEERRQLLVTALVLFCASGTGIYGALDSGMTGSHTILLSKSVMDFFTAMIFACSLGKVTSLVAIPQFLVMITLFLSAKLILPLATDAMILDFRACGGFLMLATGLRIMKVRAFPIADMIPAMILVMPMSWVWSGWITPFLR